MVRSEHRDWLAPTLTLCALWLVVTGGVVALAASMGSALPSSVAKVGPFIIAGFMTARLVSSSRRRPKVVAAAVLAVVSAVGWTSFSLATKEVPADRALWLFVLSLPINMLGGAWAYFGMFLGGRRTGKPTSVSRVEIDSEVEDLDSELEKEIARERASDRRP